MRLRISDRRLNDVFIIDCYGHLVFGEEAAELRQHVRDLLAISQRVVLNLRDVTRLDSGGAGTLVAMLTSVRSAGGEIKLANLSPRVRDILSITRLTSVFEIYTTEYDAVAAFHKAVPTEP